MIFLSYSRKDEEFAKNITNSLKLSGVNIWFDQIDIPKGSLWDNEIEKALKRCDTLIFVISKDSVKSNNVLDEISFALEENKTIIPLKINDCEIPFRIRRKQYIDFTKNREIAERELKKTIGVMSLTELPPSDIWWKKFLSKKTMTISFSISFLSYVLILFFGVSQNNDGALRKFENISIKLDTSNSILNSGSPIGSIKILDSSKKDYDNKIQENGIITATNVDVNGNEIISQEKHFDKKMAFYEGLAAVKKDGKWGFVNNKNEIVIPLAYHDVGFFKNGLALAMSKNSSLYVTIDKKGNEGDLQNTKSFQDVNGIVWYQSIINKEWYGSVGSYEIVKKSIRIGKPID